MFMILGYKRLLFVLNCKVGLLPMKYLGLPIGAYPRRLGTWDPVVEVVDKMLFRWASKKPFHG